jgi:type II secretory pathway pseudopilin PulG
MRRTGSSLPELTAVLVLTGILLAIAVPRLSHVRDAAAVRSAVDEAAADFSAARQAAIARRRLVAVVIDTNADAITARSEGTIVVVSRFRLTYGVTLAANRDSAVYDARGFGYGVSNLSLVMRRGAVADTLVVSRLGRVRW